MSRRRRWEGNSLMGVAAAVVGTAAAAQVIGPAKRPEPHPLGCDCGCDADGFTDGSHGGSPREATDPDQADQHTYVTETAPGAYEMPGRLDVVGANQRRLIALRAPEGVYIGGCLVSSAEDLERLTAWLTGCNGGAF